MRRAPLPLSPLLLALVLPAGAAEPPRAEMAEEHATFFETYCIRCHGPEESYGKMRLDTIPFDLAKDVQTADAWQKILNALNAGEMPPEGEKQPSTEEKAAFLEALSETIVVARERLGDAGGVAVMRRLNRREYRNTIRDLLGVPVDTSTLPPDGGAGRFDTVGSSQFFSPDQFERYLQLGHRALDEALVDPDQPPPTAKTVRTQVEEAANREAEEFIARYRDIYERHLAWKAADGKRPATDFGFLDDPRARRGAKLWGKNAPYYHAFETWDHTDTGTYFSGLHSNLAVGFAEDQPPGDYLIRVRIGATDEAPENRRFVEFGEMVDLGGRTDFAVRRPYQVTGTIDEPQVIEIPITLTASGGRDFRVREMRPDHGVQNWKKDPYVPPPVLWVDWIEIEGPLVQEWPPATHRRVFFEEERPSDENEYARRVIARFAERAFRGRHPEPEYLERLAAFYRHHRSSGASFTDAVKESLAVVLASPDFIYLSEQGDGDSPSDELSDRELAVRLAYFLWSAPPDEKLLALAEQGELRKPEVLRGQVDRLLDDPKSWAFVTGFAHQWLDLDRIDLFQFDQDLYPDFDESTKLAAVQEVYHHFDTLLDENLSVRNFLDSDFVVVNGLLAEYYGIEGVTGGTWRKVEAPRERGGLLAMAATLAMGSDGEKTNPVERGAFVLRKLLDDPPPPAPANVPQLSRLEDRVLTVRERLSVHREEPQCMHCHRKIDPIGFGLENFNAAGRWRDEEPVFEISYNKRGKRKKKEVGTEPVDAGGRLHEGPAFEDFFELRSVIASRTDAFSRGLLESLLEYALGRPIGYSDEKLVTELHAKSKEDDHRLRSMIHVITQSDAFRTK